jgi:putative ABC transport system permease protein
MNFVALRMLTGDRGKYLGLVFAIAFSTFLLENQTSIFVGILKRTGARIADVTDAEVWVMDADTQYFEETKALKDTDLTRVRGVPGVLWAVRLLKNLPVARTEAGRFAQTSVLGLDDVTLVGVPRKMVLGSWERLREPDSIIVDRAGYGLLYPGEPLRLGRPLQLNDHLVRIVGISDAAPTFISFPLIHTRYSVALNFQGLERSQMSFVLARPAPGITPAELTRRIAAHTGLRARTSGEFIWDCIRYMLLHTGIPVNFGITIAIAILVGAVVAGQTFYLFTVENLKQFGALKAIGVTDARLVGMILLQAATVGFIGFTIGTGLAAGFFDFMTATFIEARGMIMPWQNVALTAICMVVVVIAASLLSIRRVLVLEPAAVFRT